MSYDPNAYAPHGHYQQQQQYQQAGNSTQQYVSHETQYQYDAQQQQQRQQQFQEQQYSDMNSQVHNYTDGTAAALMSEPAARWSWSMYPTNRIDGARMVVPLGCMYAPLSSTVCPQLPYEPVTCAKCSGIMNSHSGLDLRTRSWYCPLCLSPNSLPLQYTGGGYGLPPEAQPGVDTVEYIIPAPQRQAPTFVFVIDTCVDTSEELVGLKEYVLLALSKLPEYVSVCLITYGTTVQMHELSSTTPYPRSVVLRGTQEMTLALLEETVGALNQYVAPLRDCASAMTTCIDELQRDLWPVMKDCRPMRCTGAALSVAASVLQKVSPSTGSCIFAFVSGACTTGPGIVVDTSREKMIRGHTEIRDDAATYWAASCTFYDTLMQRIVAQGHSLSCCTASLDQLGIAEMKLCIQSSGGIVLNAESWAQVPFRLSLDQLFAQSENGVLKMALNATIDVITSPSWKIQGVIGPCVGTGKKSTSVADYEIGLGGTCQWTTCMLDNTTTFAFYFDTAVAPATAAKNATRYAQIITRYELGAETRVRVTTLSHRQVETPMIQDLSSAFDQETAAALLAREAVHKTDSMPLFDVLRWLDRTVVRLVSRFGTYTKDQPSSLRLSNEFVYFPAFIYHLRRSGYLQVFNSSPDESAILRLQLLKSAVPDSIVQIQPTLYAYRMDAPAQPVSLDSKAIQPDNVLVLDTFFEVLIHYGATIAAWLKAGYAEQEEYAYFKDFLEVPMADARVLAENRYPVPRLIEVCQDDPDARILYNRINPSRSYTTAEGEAYGSQEGELIYTDDASLHVFMEHLKKLAVSQ